MRLGLEVFASDSQKTGSSWGRVALLCNQASVDRDFTPSWTIVSRRLGDQLVAFFGPQHGFHATVQDNMIESSHSHGPFSLPVYSLYSETRQPTASMLEGVDTILVDLQITGCRVYTFKYTIAGCLRAAADFGKRVVVLDRPNPIGASKYEGHVVEQDVRSFVGEFPIPLVHGLTVGEAARYFNQTIGANLDIIPMQDYDPLQSWYHWQRPWVLTSPNLPTLESVLAYPATVMFEGTNISEGRGTSLPFQLIGAPYIRNPEALIARILELCPDVKKRAFLRPASFQPTYQKWQGETCQGFQIHVIDWEEGLPVGLGLAIIRACYEVAPNDFAFTKPGYEYNYDELPINLILGSKHASEKLLAEHFSISDPFWNEGTEIYAEQAQSLLLYERRLQPK